MGSDNTAYYCGDLSFHRAYVYNPAVELVWQYSFICYHRGDAAIVGKVCVG